MENNAFLQEGKKDREHKCKREIDKLTIMIFRTTAPLKAQSCVLWSRFLI